MPTVDNAYIGAEQASAIYAGSVPVWTSGTSDVPPAPDAGTYYWWSAVEDAATADATVASRADHGPNSKNFAQASAGLRPTARGTGDASYWEFGTDDYDTAGVAADWKFLHDGSPFILAGVAKVRGADPDALSILFCTNTASQSSVGTIVFQESRTGQVDDRLRSGVYRGVSNFAVHSGTSLTGATDDEWPPDTWVTVLVYRDAGGTLKGEIDGVQVWSDGQDNTPSTSNPAGALRTNATSAGTLMGPLDVAAQVAYDADPADVDLTTLRAYLENVRDAL